MAATIASLPPDIAFAGDEIWIALETDLIDLQYSYFEFSIGGGPSAGQELELNWPGGTITYEAAASSTGTGLEWPLQGGLSTTDYADLLEEFLHQREDVMAVFRVRRMSATVIRLEARVAETFELTFDNGLSGITVTSYDANGAPTPENFRAIVEVFTDTGVLENDVSLAKLHAPFDLLSAQSWLDLHEAFTDAVAPQLPPTTQIAPVSPGGSLPIVEVTSAVLQYYFRYSEKYGSPAVAGAMVRSDGYRVVHGARSGISTLGGPQTICHDYRRRDGGIFEKPLTPTQPDWIYFLCPAGVSGVYVNLLVYWSDGTQSIEEPWGTTPATVEESHLYHMPAGFRQLGLHLVAPSGGTDPDAYIVGYDWRLGPIDDSLNYLASVRFTLYPFAHWPHFLLFDTGLGGLETVALRGKASEGYETAADEFQRPRPPQSGSTRDSAYVARGDYGLYSASGRPEWTFSTGWYTDPYYLVHLRQLPLAHAWLVDLEEERFLRVIVEPGRIEDLVKDDETLFSLPFTVRAAWLDPNANL